MTGKPSLEVRLADYSGVEAIFISTRAFVGTDPRTDDFRFAGRPTRIVLLFSQWKHVRLPIGNPMSQTKEKRDVLQGTLALMVLKTLDVLGPLHGYAIAR